MQRAFERFKENLVFLQLTVEFYGLEEEILEGVRWSGEEGKERKCEFTDEFSRKIWAEIQSSRRTKTQNQRIQRYTEKIVCDRNVEK